VFVGSKPLLITTADTGENRCIIQAKVSVSDPFKCVWRGVRRLVPKDQEFVENRSGLSDQSSLCLRRLLVRMEKTRGTSCWKGPVPLITYTPVRLIDSDYCYTDWVSATVAKLTYLIAKIVDHTVNLLDHRLREYLDFNTDLDGGDRPSGHEISRVNDRRHSRNNFAEGAISPPGSYATTPVLYIDNTVTPGQGCFNQFG
jgi:hypothetical protein